MGKVFNDKWHWGWLQWGHKLNFISPKAEQELAKIKAENPDVDFEELAEKVRHGVAPAYFESKNE